MNAKDNVALNWGDDVEGGDEGMGPQLSSERVEKTSLLIRLRSDEKIHENQSCTQL